VSFLSAREGRGVDETLKLAHELYAQSRKRAGTGELNRVLQRALEARSPSRGGHSARVFYATQADVAPPTFVLFVNDKQCFDKEYLRYLQQRLREELGFPEIPVRIALRERGAEEAERRDASGRPPRRSGRRAPSARTEPEAEEDLE